MPTLGSSEHARVLHEEIRELLQRVWDDEVAPDRRLGLLGGGALGMNDGCAGAVQKEGKEQGASGVAPRRRDTCV